VHFYHLVVFARRAILFHLEGAGRRKLFLYAQTCWAALKLQEGRSVNVQFNKLVGLPGALRPEEFAFHFPLISSVAGAKAKWTVLRVQGAYVVKCAVEGMICLSICLNIFGNRLCVWLNISVVSKTCHECMCSKSFFRLHNLRETVCLTAFVCSTAS